MKASHIICRECGKELSKEYKYCPFCGSSRRGFKRFFPLGATILYLLLFMGAIVLYWASIALYPFNESKASVLISLATALGPVSVLGLIYQFLLTREMREGAIASFSEPSETIWGDAITKLQDERKRLVDVIYVLNHLKDVGLVAAFPERRHAFEYVLDWVVGEEKEIYIVGTSFRGLFWPEPGDARILKKITDKITSKDCEVRFLLTHPAFIHLRQDLEAIQRPERFHIAQEIFDTVVMLKNAGVDPNSIRFVKATPTLFGIMTSRFMLINPYPLQRQAYTSITFVIDAQKGENPVYRSFSDAHFKGVWEGSHVEKLTGYGIEDIRPIFESTLHTLGLCGTERKIDYSKLK